MKERQFDAFEQSLLASAKADAMRPQAKRALVAALAAGAVVTTAATTATAGAAAAKAKTGFGVALAKWIAAGVAGTALVAGATKGAVHVYERSSGARTTLATTAPPGRTPSTPRGPDARTAAVAATVVDAPGEGTHAQDLPVELPAAPAITPPAAPAVAQPVAPAPAPAAAPRAPVSPVARRPRETTAPPAAPSTIAGELRSIERARSALASGDVASAERALDEHARAYPSGAFVEEADVLRIDALARRGERARADAAARAFLASRPASPYAPRVRAFIGGGEP